ncbi:MAG: tetratricopeptide repeat protein [Polyangiales bacterium]
MTGSQVARASRLALLLACLASAPTRVEAAPARGRQERPLDAPTSPQGASHLPVPAKAPPTPGPVDLVTLRRERERKVQLEHMLRERKQWVVERRAQAIALLTEFVSVEPTSAPEMPDALLRLAELRWEQARARNLEAFEAWQHASRNTRSASAPVVDVEPALELYDRILHDYPKFERLDLALYMKAYALLEAERMGDALQAYRRILDEFPASRFRPDAHMAFAESFFGRQEFARALEHYEHVARHSESELADLALFKGAFCLWKLGRTQEAARRFREVMDLSAKLSDATQERKRRVSELQDEALAYLIQVFTEDERNSAADLQRFLENIGGERYAERVLRRLSRTYFDQARYSHAIEAYRLLLAAAPADPRAPESLRTIAAAYAALEDPQHTLAALLELARDYGENSGWAKKQADSQAVRRALDASERALRTQALRYHERAQKEHQASDFDYAARLYRAHLDAFPSSPEHYAITFYLAEILFHRLGQPEAAGELYLAAAKANPSGKLSKDALYNAIAAFEAVRTAELAGCIPGDGNAAHSGKRRSAGDVRAAAPRGEGAVADPCRETGTDGKFTDAVALYVERYPRDPELPAILFRQGRLYFDRGVYDPAIRHFGELLDHYPESEYAASAGELVLESFHRADDYGNIERWARKLKTVPAFAQPEAQAKLDTLIVQAVWKHGEQLAARGEHAEAARAYLRATAEFPRDERAPKAYYNAGQEWQRAGDLEAAAKAYDALVERHPGSVEGALGAWASAQMFESIAQFQDAARYYEAYAKRFPAAPKREDALYNALVLRIAAGDHGHAVADGGAYLDAFPKGSSSDEVYLLVGKAYEADKRFHDAAETYRRYLKVAKGAARTIEAQTRLGKVLSAEGQLEAADRSFSLAAKAGHKTDLPSARYYAAEARFQQGDRVLADFEKVQIAGDVAGLRKRLARKSELLRKASDIYADVVDYRVSEWVTAALYKIGQSYELFAESLRNAPIPPGLSEAEEQVYRDELAKFIVPIEERALEAYESGYRKALELHVFNTWTQKQREALTRLNDIEYPPLREAGAGLAEDRLLPMPAPLDGLRRPNPAQPNAAQPNAASKGAPQPANPGAPHG